MTDRSRDIDEQLSADIRRLAGRGSTPSPQGEDAPLDLTSVVAPSEPPLVLTERVSQDPSAPPATPPAPPSDAPTTSAGEPVDRSISGTLAKLDAREAALETTEAKAESEDMSVSNRRLDEVVQEAIRPMIADWLDQNLERIVREEVAARIEMEQGAGGPSR